MRYTIIGKGVEVTDKLKNRITSKIDRLQRLFDDETSIQVTVVLEKLTYKIEVTIPLKRRTLRAEVKKNDIYSAIDEIVDVIEKQMIKYKERLRSRSRHDHTLKEEFVANFDENELNEPAELGNRIVKTKKFEVKPMDADDAAMEMELLGHNFFVFRNGKTDEINVVYKRKNGGFGLIEPEY